METGKVEWFNEAKGFGYIAPDDEGEDILVLLEDCRVTGGFPSEGQRVKYEIKTVKGQAANTGPGARLAREGDDPGSKHVVNVLSSSRASLAPTDQAPDTDL